MSFSTTINGWSKETTQKINRDHKAVVFNLFSSVIKSTPVLDGRARANWIMSNDSPDRGTQLEIFDKSGDSTIGKMGVGVGKIQVGKDFDVYLNNNLPYIYGLEYGKSSKSRKGMVRVNYQRMVAILQKKYR